MFTQMKIELSEEYNLVVTNKNHIHLISIYYKETFIGNAQIITDDVDVECITSIRIENEHVNKILNQNYTLGEIFVKFLIKFPTMVRKPEFRFIYDPPENLKSILAKYHFDNDSTLKSNIMVRSSKILNAQDKINEEIFFISEIESNEIYSLLSLLQKNTYWQSHLTLDRLNLLIKNSRCFFAKNSDNRIIGFSRVLTDYRSFASLWDVVVDEQHRGKGIGVALMRQVFSDPVLADIENWILFTDTAKKLYEQFGFTSEASNVRFVVKCRLQDKCPDYMHELGKIINSGLPVHLNSEKAMEFLFGDSGKRQNLPGFWKEACLLDDTVLDKMDYNSKTLT